MRLSAPRAISWRQGARTRALGDAVDARLRLDYGYLLYCQGRNELRRAIEQYVQAIELDPTYDKPHFQLIAAYAGLGEPELAVAMYERRFAAAPAESREHRFLAQAYISACEYRKALEVVAAGLRLAPGDATLTALRGEARAGCGDSEGALADWRLALELEPEDIGALYSSAFLLERKGRLDDAADAWQEIVEWHEARGHRLQAEWPRRELERILG